MVTYSELPSRGTETLHFGAGGPENESWYELNLSHSLDSYTDEVKEASIVLWISGPGEQDLTDTFTPQEVRDLAAALVRWADACEADRRLIGQGDGGGR